MTVEYQWSDEDQASFIRNAKLELVAVLEDKEQIIGTEVDMLQACIWALRKELIESAKGDGE
jgi:hypothetical protein